jgi:hypothetical protein
VPASIRPGRIAPEHDDVCGGRAMDGLRRAICIDPVDDRWISSANPQPAHRIDMERPDAFLLGVEEWPRGSVGLDRVDPSIRSRCGVYARSRNREREDVVLGGIENRLFGLIGAEANHAAISARSGPERPVGRLCDGQIWAGVDVSRFVSWGPAVTTPLRLT